MTFVLLFKLKGHLTMELILIILALICGTPQYAHLANQLTNNPETFTAAELQRMHDFIIGDDTD